MAAGKLGTENEGSFWYGDFNPQAGASVSLEMVVGFIRFGWSEMTSKHVLCDRVRPSSMLERRNQIGKPDFSNSSARVECASLM